MTQQHVSHSIQKKIEPQKKIDKTFLTSVVFLLMFGIVTLFSATYYKAQDLGDPFMEVKEQLLFMLLGACLMVFLSRVPYKLFLSQKVATTALCISMGLLLLVLIPGFSKEVNGSKRWLKLFGFSFQPGEIAKYFTVLFLACALTKRGQKMQKFFKGIVPVLLPVGIMFLLILKQPNLSTAGTLLMVSVMMIMISGAKIKHIMLLVLMGIFLFFFYAMSEPYRKERMLSFRNPFEKMSDEGYQLSQSLIAFGSGGFFGMGLGQGRQKFAYLPYPESDFIFAIVGEDFGLLGCIAVVIMFVVFLLTGMRIALQCEDTFGILLASSIIGLITIQTLINMCVVVGLVPTTGLPLPFFSAGGTSLAMTMGAIGIVLNISRYKTGNNT